jgi:hypothetical protein
MVLISVRFVERRMADVEYVHHTGPAGEPPISFERDGSSSSKSSNKNITLMLDSE